MLEAFSSVMLLLKNVPQSVRQFEQKFLLRKEWFITIDYKLSSGISAHPSLI